MLLACWRLGLNIIRIKNEEDSKLANAAFYFIVPLIIISLFVGMGPPPDSAAEWTATATEQQVRYFMLTIVGVFVAFGFVSLRNRIKAKGENYFSLLSMIAVIIAIPLFIINMLYWGFYLTELYKMQNNSGATTLPEWFLPMKQLFGLVSVVEVALTYFATFAIVVALRKVGLLSKTSSYFYSIASLLAFLIIILSAFFVETFKIPGFAVSIPAIPFLMPYFIAVNLLRKLGNN